MSAVVQVKVAQRYPGVELASPVQGWAYLDEHELGIATFKCLEGPSAADDRWLGVCYRERFAELPAREAFYRAIARGEEAARLDLALLLIAIDRGTEARGELERVERAKLLPCDDVLFLRIRSVLKEEQGELQVALRSAEEAWRKVQSLPEFDMLAPPVLAQLGFLHSHLGEVEKARWCLERAAQIATGLRALNVQLRRADALIALGLFAEARDGLESLDLSKAPWGLQIKKSVRLGETLWSLGHHHKAARCFLHAIRSGSESHAFFEAFRCRLSTATLLGFAGDGCGFVFGGFCWGFGEVTRHHKRRCTLCSKWRASSVEWGCDERKGGPACTLQSCCEGLAMSGSASSSTP
jgi:tetratricopeptide (TPR) repeat protein